MGGDTDMDRALGCIELRPGLQEIERQSDCCRAQPLPGLLVITAPQPAAQASAADRPGFPVALDPQVGKGDAGGGMKQLDGRRYLEEHVGKHGGCQVGDALPASGDGAAGCGPTPDVVSETTGCGA